MQKKEGKKEGEREKRAKRWRLQQARPLLAFSRPQELLDFSRPQELLDFSSPGQLNKLEGKE